MKQFDLLTIADKAELLKLAKDPIRRITKMHALNDFIPRFEDMPMFKSNVDKRKQEREYMKECIKELA